MSSDPGLATSNPFAILGVTTRDDRSKIMEAAEEKSLVTDQNLCRLAQSALTNPRRRLEAELGWFPGTSPKVAEAAARSTLGDVSELPLAGLAKANALAMSASKLSAVTVSDLGDLIEGLAQAVSELDVEQITREVNEDREVAGFPPVTSQDAVEEGLRERRQVWRRAAISALQTLPPSEMAEVLIKLLLSRDNDASAPHFVHELIDDYALRAQPYIVREIAGAEGLTAKARELAASRPDALSPIITALEKMLVTWDQFTRPIQISATQRGRSDEDSEKLAFTIRSLSIDLFNDYNLLDESRRVSALVGRTFSRLPKVASKIAEDAEALTDLEEQAAQQETELAYAAQIGTFVKTRIAIDSSGVEWRGHRTPLSAVRGARWGAIRKSINGIPTGTDYLIAWSDGRHTTTAEFRNGAIFEAFIPRLWKAVGIRLVNEMIASLGAGGELTFGKLVANDESVMLTQRKLFSSERVVFGWHEVSVSSADGSFIVYGPKGSKASETMSYRDVENIHFFEALVRQAFKNGCVRLSDAFA